ncbi:MAG: nuclear transport factor 2 family protein [Bacteroidetes bacterium]|nr:nuclear transport factor 2 family protein [Bacteroidota bacterium]MBS1633352.1 nuclear transport factor 2 family protein [Bacteroidota bacterium]
MKKVFFPSIFIFLILSILSCNSKTETESETQKRIDNESVKAKNAISENNLQIGKWYKAKQIDSVLSYMADNIIQFPPNNKPLIGKDSIRNYWNQLFQFGDIDFSLQTQDVKANGPLAIEWGKYDLKFTPNEKSPIPAFADNGNYLVYWQKINNDWKAVWDAPVSAMPLPPK